MVVCCRCVCWQIYEGFRAGRAQSEATQHQNEVTETLERKGETDETQLHERCEVGMNEQCLVMRRTSSLVSRVAGCLETKKRAPFASYATAVTDELVSGSIRLKLRSRVESIVSPTWNLYENFLD